MKRAFDEHLDMFRFRFRRRKCSTDKKAGTVLPPMTPRPDEGKLLYLITVDELELDF